MSFVVSPADALLHSVSMNVLRQLVVALALAGFLLAPTLSSAAPPVYPTKVGPTGRYLVDQNNAIFLLVGEPNIRRDRMTVFQDATALLTGSWGSDQELTATGYNPNNVSDHEVELRVRSSISATKCTGYEAMFAQLPLAIVSKGRFDKSEPTIYKGEDLDIPTYIRRGVALN